MYECGNLYAESARVGSKSEVESSSVSTRFTPMSYTILGRAIKTEYLALGTLLSTVGLSYAAASEVKDSVKFESSSKEEDELYAFHPHCIFCEVGDDLTGPKASENSSKRRRRGRSIRYIHSEDVARSSLAIRSRCTPLRMNKAIVCHS
ncbi:hypothetical protein BJV77DRAFT_988112 [Russula vinacea]|nr:hypothetical protein BJV77DRAFT_988112 [Russula vinacea]